MPSPRKSGPHAKLSEQAKAALYKRVLEWIAPKQRFCSLALAQAHRNSMNEYVSASFIRALLAELELKRAIEKILRPRTGRRGRPKAQEYVVRVERVQQLRQQLLDAQRRRDAAA